MPRSPAKRSSGPCSRSSPTTATTMPSASPTTPHTACRAPCSRLTRSALRESRRGCASARSTSTAASGTRQTCRSVDTSNPASAGRWAWPVSRSTSRPKPVPRQRIREASVGLYGDQFNEKVGVVTGGGIGQVSAEALAREGAAVVVADINTEGAQKVADGIKGEGGTALALHVDVSDPDSAKKMAVQTLSEFGGIDYLVNNAAIFGGMKLDFLVSVDWDYYKKFMSVNLDGALVCTRAVYRKMAKRGGGAIVNQSSTAAWLYSNFYGLAKVGINGLTQQLATELGGQNIRINAIAPGPIDTEANRTTTPQEMVADIVKGIPLSRMGEVDDLTGMCLFLLSDQAKWITGQIFNVDGGQIIR